jgi:hypothetical protein
MSRLVWLAAGVGIGVVVARRLEQSGPMSAVETVAEQALRHLRRAVDALIADGRAEMRTSEARLRAVLAAPESTNAAEAGPRNVAEG